VAGNVPVNTPLPVEKYIDVNGIRTRYLEAGQGAPLVLFHGGNMGSANLAECAEDWELNIPGLSRRFRVIAVDKLGQGYTDNPRTDADYTMSATVQHAYDFMVALDLKDANIVGHSRGGYLVARLTLDYPERIRSCTIVDTNTLAPGVPASQQVLANPPLPRMSRESQRWIIERYSFSPTHITPYWLDKICAVAVLPKSLHATEKMQKHFLSKKQFMPNLSNDKDSVFARLRDSGMPRPTLVMWGRNDPTAILRQGEIIFDLIAERQRLVRMCVLNRAGHFCFREQASAFNASIAGFIASL
jgi:pimeloyl-ACP methyl ester carboxylesterase